MKGKPKYKLNDDVTFIINNEKLNGTIYIIDEYGTFFDPSDVSYDIFVKEKNCLYKHIREDYVNPLKT